MGQRAGLHNLLCNILRSLGDTNASDHVYFQPPSNIRIAYPCIIYSLANIDTKFADNIPYAHQRQYSLTVIDKNPDSLIVDKVASLPRCSFDHPYTADNLNHWAFSIYY